MINKLASNCILLLTIFSSLVAQSEVPTYCPDDFKLIVSELGQDKALSLSEMTNFKKLIKGMPARTQRQKNEFTGEMDDVILIEDSEFIYNNDNLSSFRIKNNIIQLEVEPGKIVFIGMQAEQIKDLFPAEYVQRKTSYLDEESSFIHLLLCHPIYPDSRVSDQTLVISWDSKVGEVTSIHISNI